MSQDISKYISCMEEIKLRVNYCHFLLDDEQLTNAPIMFAIEAASIQIRKILELIAFSSITANKEEYSKHFPLFSKHWRGKEIIAEMEKINPNFYPRPSKQIINHTTGKVEKIIDIKEGFLSKAQYVEVYDYTSNFIHARNVYGTSLDYEEAPSRLRNYLSEVTTLLNHHTIRLCSSDNQWWVIMQGEDGKIHLAEMEKIY